MRWVRRCRVQYAKVSMVCVYENLGVGGEVFFTGTVQTDACVSWRKKRSKKRKRRSNNNKKKSRIQSTHIKYLFSEWDI